MNDGLATSVASLRSTVQPSRLLSYAQLLRIPNVFTAMADIALAAIVTGLLPEQWLPFSCLLLASGFLYSAGMVWNDYFDYEQDLKERPERPLPSHRITRRTAARLGTILVAVGLLFAALAGLRSDGYRFGPPIVGILLIAAIFLYDSGLKRTVLGPVGMGMCRFLNVVFGLTLATGGVPAWGFVLALVVGFYIVGVTWFARREARISKQPELAAAALVMLTALGLALFLPVLGPQQFRGNASDGVDVNAFGELGHILFPYLLVAIGFWIGVPASAAIRSPSPKNVQRTVKRAILGLIVLDAILATSLAGTPGLLILLLLPPAICLAQWVYST